MFLFYFASRPKPCFVVQPGLKLKKILLPLFPRVLPCLAQVLPPRVLVSSGPRLLMKAISGSVAL